MMFKGNYPQPNGPSAAAKLVGGEGKDVALNQTELLRLDWRPPHWAPNKEPDARGIPAFYDLAGADNRVMVEWLLGCCQSDPRYWLAEVLLDPKVQARYDRVIIDAPPRMVAGCVQALCASTSVLIPTVLDQLSADAVDRFIVQIEEERILWPMLKIVGVVGTMCSTTLRFIHERDSIRLLIERLENRIGRPQLFPASAFVAENTLLSQAAGARIVYAEKRDEASHRELRKNIKLLAAAIEEGLRGERTYEAWKTWLKNRASNSAVEGIGSNGSGSESNAASISIS
jgi:cellulose biosynthesis protein BcsQ